jgi:peptide deformylase
VASTGPILTPLDGAASSAVAGWEGCISLPDLRGVVPRFKDEE